MEIINWGLLGPEVLANERRTRTLGLGASIRSFNELAVPGIGGVWFGKQLYIAILGVAVAEQARLDRKQVQNIETANAIEALACFLTYTKNNWSKDSRLLGGTKMKGKDKNDLRFELLRKAGFYVTQPMRMATVRSLPALGLVNTNGSRFNAFECSQAGRNFIEAQGRDYDACYYNYGVFDCLVKWVNGDSNNVATNEKIRNALSPIEPMTLAACDILKERLLQGGQNERMSDKERRRAALDWVESLRVDQKKENSWKERPATINSDHWHDLFAGSLFFATRDAAIRVLDQLEIHIKNNCSDLQYSLDGAVPQSTKTEIQTLRSCAKNFLDQKHTDNLANSFCKECIDDNDSILLSNLVKRDERVLCLRGRIVSPGPAFRSKSASEHAADEMENEPASESSKVLKLPEGISHRMRNLFYINADIQGELNEWLDQSVDIASEEESYV
jgi:hypothetical protein